MAAEELRRRMQHDVGAPFDRTDEVGRGQRIVDDQRHACSMGDARDGFDVGDDAAGIGDAFDEHRLGPRCHRLLERLGIARVGPIDVPVELGKSLAELVDRAAIELTRRYDVVAGAHQRVQRDELGGMARCDGERGAAAFQCGDALLQNRVGRVHDARIDVAEDLEIEQRGGVIRIFEHEGRGLVDRCGARAGRRIGLGARVHAESVEAVVRHRRLHCRNSKVQKARRPFSSSNGTMTCSR